MKILLIIILSTTFLISCVEKDNSIDENFKKCVDELDLPAEEVTEIRCRFRDIKDISGISSYINLETLDIEGNEVTDITPLQNTKGILHLDLSGNPITNYSILKDLPALESISVSSFNLEFIKLISSIGSLKSISLEDSELTEEMVDELENLSNLRILHLKSNNFVVFPDLSGFPSLIYLTLSNEDSLTDTGNIKLLTSLQYLTLNNIEISDISFIASLLDLEQLVINDMNNINLEVINSHPNLSVLDIYNSSLLGDVNLLITSPSLESIKLFNISTLTCEDAAKLEDTFGEIYFEHHDSLQCI